MMLRVACKMMFDKKARFCFTLFGLSMLFVLSVAQVGLVIGWCNTITAIVRHAAVDIWVMNQGTIAFDYGTALPRHRVYQVRNVPGVAWTEGMYVGWSKWQRADGSRHNVQLVGLDRSSVGAPWDMTQGCVEDIYHPDRVIVDELYLKKLGVKQIGDEIEMYGHKATVCGFSRGVRTMTASPFVFTSMTTVRKYDLALKPDETTYVLVRCVPGTDPPEVAHRIATEVPGVEALTTEQMMARSEKYWVVGTGIGLILLSTAALGMVVSTIVTSQTLFNITQDHLANYATLLALGFKRSWLLGCVLTQALLLGGLAIVCGSLAVYGLSIASAHSHTPVETTPRVFAGLVAAALASCLLGSYLSVKAILRIDPVTVFRA
jgi:putative ABC transport system permease protein